jgi:hypothetical protein
MFRFEDSEAAEPTHSLTATHPAELFISVPVVGPLSLTEPAMALGAPPGLPTRLTNQGDPTRLWAYFTPTAEGPLTFSATWLQLSQAEGPTCTAGASGTVAVTAPTPSRVARQLGFSVDHRGGHGHRGSTNEIVLTSYVLADRARGDRSPIQIAVRVGSGSRPPSAASPATTLTFDPRKGRTHTSTPLVRLDAVDLEDTPLRYQLTTAVYAYPSRPHGKARRSIEVTISQSAHVLTRYRFTTSCEALFGGLFCTPRPKNARPG